MTGGLSLARRFFIECVEPLVRSSRPDLRYAAALIGTGSEVLGFDTAMSTDHDWGPRLQMFLPDATFSETAPVLLETLEEGLLSEFDGWPTSFVDPGRPTTADLPSGALGSTHGVELFSLAGWMKRHLALESTEPLAVDDWLALPEQTLLEAVAGAVFRDDTGDLTVLRETLSYYPRDVWLYRLASQWQRIAEEQAFVGRAGEVGDDLGSRLIAARLLQAVVRLLFQIERVYAPYAKWLGTALRRLPSAAHLAEHEHRVLTAETWEEREAALVACYRLAANLQLERGVPGALLPVVGPYFGRPFTVINADELAAGLRAKISDENLRRRPLMGSVDQVSDNVSVLTNPARARAFTLGLPGR